MVVEAQSSQAGRNAGENKSKRYAVVVGINDYSGTGTGNLSFCAADAEAFYEALLTYCEYDPACIVLFSDGPHDNAQKPLRSDILQAIADMSTRATNEDSVLFFFAGHGTRDSRDSYLLTQEFRTSVVADTSIPMNMINDYLRQSKARFTMRFFDACHSGRIGARAAPVGPDIKKHFLVEGEGWATLSACKEDQFAHEDPDLGHGIFSYCLVKGLSGDAATPEQEITLHSLSMYTITKTNDITNELGLPQTPVFDSHHAGNLVLATVCSTPTVAIPPALVKVQETDIDQIRPTLEKIPQFIADIRSTLQKEPLQLDYVASSQEEKLARGSQLVQKIYGWCQEQERQYHEQLEELATITVKHQSIQTCPLNLQLAEYIQDSKIKQAVALRLTYKKERVASKLWLPSFLDNYETHEVLNGIAERPGYYETAVMLMIMTNSPLMPICAMVVAIVPMAFGLYLLRYTCSTQLDHTQKEYWDSATFSVRTLHAIPFTDNEGVQTLEELQDLYPQLVSFFAESCSARRAYLQSIGGLGQSLL
jgi:Caspase domain